MRCTSSSIIVHHSPAFANAAAHSFMGQDDCVIRLMSVKNQVCNEPDGEHPVFISMESIDQHTQLIISCQRLAEGSMKLWQALYECTA